MKLIRKGLWFLILALLAYVYFVPAILEQKQKEWEENGMGSVLETLNADQDQEE